MDVQRAAERVGRKKAVGLRGPRGRVEARPSLVTPSPLWSSSALLFLSPPASSPLPSPASPPRAFPALSPLLPGPGAPGKMPLGVY